MSEFGGLRKHEKTQYALEDWVALLLHAKKWHNFNSQLVDCAQPSDPGLHTHRDTTNDEVSIRTLTSQSQS